MHPPHYSARIKSSSNTDVGYIDIEARHLFYYFEQNAPPRSVFDLTFISGPGASAFLGLFKERGPRTITSDNATEYNPYSWNSNTNMLICQLVGVGFSFAAYDETVPWGRTRRKRTAKDIAAFLAIFFESMEGLKRRGLYVVGESYGVRRILLYDLQAHRAQGSCPLPAGCENTFVMITCQVAQSFCDDHLAAPFQLTGKSIECVGEAMDTLYYPATTQIAKYLNLPSTTEILGIKSLYPTISIVRWVVNAASSTSSDVHRSNSHHVEALLEPLEWFGQAPFSAEPLRAWAVDGELASETQSFEGLTFATLRDTGHQAPYGSPVQALALISRWLADNPP
ncbi:serine carboxypeptidase [Mycena galericulata]|nr:serine carboxypeptidase [Mycena galericulata]